MTPGRILFFGLVAVGVLLYALNPGPEKFEVFLREEAARQAEEAARAAGTAAGGNVVGGVGAFIAQRLGREVGGAAAQAFERENYHVASVYRIDLNGPPPGGEWAFLGIANAFIPIETPELPSDRRRP